MAPTRQVVLALDGLRLIVTIGGKLARGRGFSRRNLVSGRSPWDRNHDAAMRIGGEAPRGGPNLVWGVRCQALLPSSTSISRSFFLEGCGELLSRDRQRWPPHVRWYWLWTG